MLDFYNTLERMSVQTHKIASNRNPSSEQIKQHHISNFFPMRKCSIRKLLLVKAKQGLLCRTQNADLVDAETLTALCT